MNVIKLEQPKFKPCPFCRARKWIFVGSVKIGDLATLFCVACKMCGAQGPQWKTKKGAIEKWNFGFSVERKNKGKKKE